jgi:tetrapyrrole methylase family protein/MazG family protein
MGVIMKNQEYIKEHYTWEDLQRIVHVLMQPDGCPWDSTRDYENMKECVLNEAAEVAEAVDNKDFINLREELGDLLLQVVMYSEIARKRGEFTLEDVIDGLAKKMVGRHPNVFDDGSEKTYLKYVELGASTWNSIKLQEKIKSLEEYEKYCEEGRIAPGLVEHKRRKITEFEGKIGIFNKISEQNNGKML